MKSFLSKLSWYDRAKDLGLSLNVIVVIIALSLVSTVTEMFGIGLFLPIFQFMRLEGNIDALVVDSTIWQYIVNVFMYLNLQPSLPILLLVSFLFITIRQLFIYVRTIYSAAVTKRLTQLQYNRLFNRYIESDTSYQDSIPIGSLTNIIMTESGGAVGAAMTPIGLIVSIVVLLGYLTVLFMLSWEMTLFSIMVISFATLIPKVWIKQSETTGRKLVKANTLMSEFLVSRLRSPRLVRLSGTEGAEKQEFYNLTLRQRKYQVLSAILLAKTTVVLEPIIVALSLTFLYLSYSVMHLQIEEIGLYLVIALRLIPTVQSILRQFQTMQGSLGSIEVLQKRINEMKSAVEDDTGTIVLSTLNQSILFNNVSYRYPTGRDYALKDVTIEIKSNNLTLVVGPSGSGKSTLIDLLPRLRVADRGSIQIDGKNINRYTLKSLRGVISYAPQSPQIFDGTVKNHIRYGKPDATDNEVQEATYLAGAEEFINQLPNGFDTILGEEAVKLSGGQRQRLDLARSLVSKSSILILDEPTSNLDIESEEMFSRALSRIRSKTNTTIIIVTHRLASIMDVDKIIVLNKGKVEATGTHLELMAQDGWYAKACKIQMSKE
jgi:ABC-type multidrug transport system fused ATPase/permease subunit